jgi:hypothetical protein
MMTKRNGLQLLLAALSLTACATGHAQVLGGRLTGNSVVAGSLGGSLGSPAIDGTFNGAFDGTVSGALDADATGLRRAGEHGVDSTASRTSRARRAAVAEGEQQTRRSETNHAASLTSTSAANTVAGAGSGVSQVTANSMATAAGSTSTVADPTSAASNWTSSVVNSTSAAADRPASASQTEPAGNARTRPEAAMPRLGGHGESALDGGVATGAPATAGAGTSATASGSAQASVE